MQSSNLKYALDVAWRRLRRRDPGNQTRWHAGLAELFSGAGARCVCERRSGARPCLVGALSGSLQDRAVLPHQKKAWELFRIGTKDSYNTDPAKRATHKEGSQFPVDALDQFAKQGIPRWASTTPRCCNRDRPLRCSERGSQAVRPEKTHEQGLRSRCPCIFLPDINRP